MSESSRAMSSACFISLTVSGRNAFRTSGRLMVIFAMPSSVRSYLMSVKSWSFCQVSAMERKLSRADELTQASGKRLRLLPRNAVPGIRADPQLRVREFVDHLLANLEICVVALPDDPQQRDLDLVKSRRKRRLNARRLFAQLARELATVVVPLESLDDVAAEDRLRVPVAHHFVPRIVLEPFRPRLVARA